MFWPNLTRHLRAVDRRRTWTRSGRILAVLLICAALCAPAFTIANADAMPDATDVTGAGASHGQVTLEQLQSAVPGALVSAHTLVSGGLRRGYLVVAPAVRTGALPLIVVLHGVNSSATQEVGRDEFAPLAEHGQAILVYPAGYGESWNVGADGCCGLAGESGVNDVAFVQAVTHAAEANWAVDPARVFLVGFSNGGKLAYQVMCSPASRYAAVAIMAAVPLGSCSTARASPIWLGVGAKDSDLPEQGATEAVTRVFPPVVADWRTRDGCGPALTVDRVGPATVTTWRDCTPGMTVRSVVYADLGHAWPGSATEGVAASGATLIWAFFSAQATT